MLVRKALAIFSLCVLFLASNSNLSFAAPSSSASALAKLSTRINAHMRRVIKTDKLQGISATVILPDGKRVSSALGNENVEYGTKISSKTIFQIGSTTKLFTAFAVQLLAQEGKLSVEDPLTKYFPDASAWSGIRVKDLLQHLSGLPDFSAIPGVKDYPKEDWRPEQVLELMQPLPLAYETGTRAHYTNSSYVLLGLIIEQASGKSYWRYLYEKIARPLGMKNTNLGSDTRIAEHRAVSYEYNNGRLVNAEHESIVLPFSSGALMSTSQDLVLLSNAIRTRKILSKTAMDEMLTPFVLNDQSEPWADTRGGYGSRWISLSYGFAFELLKDANGRMAYSKTGQIADFNSFFMYYPDSQIGVALISNTANSLATLITNAQWLEETARKALN